MAEQKLVKTHNLKIRIREKCLEKGIATAYQLQKQANLAPSVSQNLFSETFSEISLQTLEKLLEALDCVASDLFVKEPNEMQKAKEILKLARRILILTGAGVSAESNVPTFRGGGGTAIWRGMPFEQLSSAQMVAKNLPLVWEWFDYRRDIISDCNPNDAHRAIADWQRNGNFDELTLVTQNIDGLHNEAGSTNILELHGNIWQAKCLTCKEIFDVRDLPADERPPICLSCGDSMRPNVVLFGENLSAQTLKTASEKAKSCDVCLVIGTSSLVYPAASLPEIARQSGAKVIEINPEETSLTASANVSIRRRAGEFLPELSPVLIEKLQNSQDKFRRAKQNENSAPSQSHSNSSTLGERTQTDEAKKTFSSLNTMTSETHPLRVDFVESTTFPALQNLGMTFAPGKKQPNSVSGEWCRDLMTDLLRLRDFYKVDILISLIEQKEFETLGISDLEAECSKRSLDVIRYPIKDYNVPADVKSYIALIDKIVENLEQDKKVVIHCKGGLGRAGMTAACAIVAATKGSIRGAQAIEIVRAARHKAVETLEQEKFVQTFFEEWQKSRESSPKDQVFPDINPIGNIKVVLNSELTEANIPVMIDDEWEIFALSFGTQDYSKLNEEAQEIYHRTGNLGDLSLDQLRGSLLSIQRQKYWSFDSHKMDDSSRELIEKIIDAIRQKVRNKGNQNVLSSDNTRSDEGIFLGEKDELILDKVWDQIAAEDRTEKENKNHKTLILTFACEGGGVDIYRRKNELGEWVYTSEGSDLDEDDEAGIRSWRKESATLSEAIKENVNDYHIFIFTPLFIHPEYKPDIKRYLEDLFAALSETEREHLQQFAEHSAITREDWIKRGESKMKKRSESEIWELAEAENSEVAGDETINSFLARNHFSEDDRELIRHCLKTEKNENSINIIIEVLDYWESTHQPILKWVIADELAANSQQSVIDERIRKILNDKKYFDVCADCNTRVQKGWLVDKYCSSCAWEKHGIVS